MKIQDNLTNKTIDVMKPITGSDSMELAFAYLNLRVLGCIMLNHGEIVLDDSRPRLLEGMINALLTTGHSIKHEDLVKLAGHTTFDGEQYVVDAIDILYRDQGYPIFTDFPIKNHLTEDSNGWSHDPLDYIIKHWLGFGKEEGVMAPGNFEIHFAGKDIAKEVKICTPKEYEKLIVSWFERTKNFADYEVVLAIRAAYFLTDVNVSKLSHQARAIYNTILYLTGGVLNNHSDIKYAFRYMTDIRRVMGMLFDLNPNPDNKTKYGNIYPKAFKRRLRDEFLRLANEDELSRFGDAWKRINFYLNISKEKLESSAKKNLLHRLHGEGEKLRSYQGKLDMLFNSDDPNNNEKIFSLLKERPLEAYKNLARLGRRSAMMSSLLATNMEEVIPSMALLANITDALHPLKRLSITDPKEQTLTWLEPSADKDGYPLVETYEIVRNTLSNALAAMIRQKYGCIPEFDFTYRGAKLTTVMFPESRKDKSVSQSFPRGTAMELPDAAVIRAYMAWENYGDMDISVIKRNAAGVSEKLGWDSFCNVDWAFFSGDDTTGGPGAVEYIDMKTDAIKDSEGFIICANAFGSFGGRHIAGSKTQMGIMLIDHIDRNVKGFNKKSALLSSDLTTTASEICSLYIHKREGKLSAYVVDVNTDGGAVSNSNRIAELIMQYIDQLETRSLTAYLSRLPKGHNVPKVTIDIESDLFFDLFG